MQCGGLYALGGRARQQRGQGCDGLGAGNMLAKQLEYLGGADSAGIVMGARVPVVLTSRADSRQTRLASCAIALMLAQRYRVTPP